jgi:hypothetical protein
VDRVACEDFRLPLGMRLWSELEHSLELKQLNQILSSKRIASYQGTPSGVPSAHNESALAAGS